MNIESIQIINPINDKLSNIITENTITGETLNQDLDSNTLVVNVFDTFDNFLLQKIIKEGDYTFLYDNEEQFLKNIRKIISEDENLNINGVYRLRYYFVGDIFDSLTNLDNSFIITEISADNTELRLNPKSNNEDFIKDFNRFKSYIKPTPVSETLEKQVNKVVKLYVGSLFGIRSDKLTPIIENSVIIAEGEESINIKDYLIKYYNEEEVGGIIGNIRQDISAVQGRFTNLLSNLIKEDEELINLYRTYKDNPTSKNFDFVEKRIYDLFLSNFLKELFNIIDIQLKTEF